MEVTGQKKHGQRLFHPIIEKIVLTRSIVGPQSPWAKTSILKIFNYRNPLLCVKNIH